MHVPRLAQFPISSRISRGTNRSAVRSARRGGKVVEVTGVDALAGYMKDAKLLAQPALSLDDMTALLELFDAYATSALRDRYYVLKEHKTLMPTFELHDGAARLKLYYPWPGHGGAVPRPNIIKVTRATLDIAKDYRLSWSSETFDFDTKQP